MPGQHNSLAEQILDQALQLGEQQGWEAVQLNTVAAALGISLDEVRQYYAQKDDLVEAWFDRADRAMLGNPDLDPGHGAPEQRLGKVIMSWLDALAPHRRLTREMLLYKLEPGHVHLQALAVMRISRTVQWFREAARLESTHMKRILEETGLTAVYLATLMRWMMDDSPESRRTRQFLDNALRRCSRFGDGLNMCCGVQPSRAGSELPEA